MGPDDLEVFVKLQKITSLLNKTHILPYNTDLNEERPVNVFFIGRDQIGVRAKVRIQIKFSKYSKNTFIFFIFLSGHSYNDEEFGLGKFHTGYRIFHSNQ